MTAPAETSATPLVVKPEVVLLEDLFEEIKQGKLRSPRFQRPFIWRPEDMRKLFESVVKGYPIGSLLIWEPGVRYQVQPRFGPIPQADPAKDERNLAYVLDGQHRLATLFGATHVEGDLPDRSSEQLWWMWYDLDKEEFTHAPRGVAGPHHLPVRDVLATTQFLRFCARLLHERPGDGAALVDRAERVARLIRGFRVPVVRIRGGKLEDAIDIFSRLNSSGVPMAADQLVSALTYREGDTGSFDLATRITEVLERLGALHFGGIDRVVILRSIAGVAGIKIHSRPGEQVADFLLGKKFTPETREELVQRTSNGMVAASQWLVDQGVVCDRLLPYALQLVLLTQFFCVRRPSADEETALRRWFFATSFAGWFAGGNTTQVNNDLAEMGDFQAGITPGFQAFRERSKPFPDRFDLKSARVRTLVLATLIRRRPLHRRGVPVDAVALFTGEDAVSVPKVFAREAPPVASAPANRILLPTFEGKGARQQLLDVPLDERAEVLASHCINDAAWEALRLNDPRAFVEARTAHLIDLERTFMKGLEIVLPERDMDDDIVGDAGE